MGVPLRTTESREVGRGRRGVYFRAEGVSFRGVDLECGSEGRACWSCCLSRHEDHQAETRQEASWLFPQQFRSPRALPDPSRWHILPGGAAGSHPAAGAAAPLPHGRDPAVHHEVGLRGGVAGVAQNSLRQTESQLLWAVVNEESGRLCYAHYSFISAKNQNR